MQFLAIFTAVFLLCNQLGLKLNHNTGKGRILAVAVCTGTAAAISLLVASLKGEGYRADMLPYSVVYACIYFVCTLCCYKAYELGPVAGVALFSSAGLVFTVLFGVFVYDEPFGWLSRTGVACMLVALTCLSLPERIQGRATQEKKPYNRLWILLGIFIMLANSGGAILLKVRQTKAGGEDAFAFISLCYVFICLISSLTYAIVGCKQKGIRQDFTDLKNHVGAITLQTAGNAGTNMLATYLSTRIDGAVLYPVQSGGGFVLTVLFGFCFFKERVTVWKIIGLILGVGAIVLLNL